MGLYYFISSFLPAPVIFHFNLKILLGCFQCDELIYFFFKGFPELTHSPTLKITTDSNERAHFQCEFTQLAADVNYIVEFYVNGKMAANVTNTSSPVTVEETDIGDLTYGNSVSTGSVNHPIFHCYWNSWFYDHFIGYIKINSQMNNLYLCLLFLSI